MKNSLLKLGMAIFLAILFFANISIEAQSIFFTTNTTIAATNMAYDGQAIVVSNVTVNINGPHSFSSIEVATNGVVSCTVGQSNLNLTVTGNLTVDLGGSVLVDGLGYQGPGSGNGNGPGGGGGGVAGSYTPGGGGGYGGNGGNSTGAGGGASYGSLTAPTNWGSSGGTGHDTYSGYYYIGGNGGGAMQLVVGGQLQVNGQITANGINGGTQGNGWYPGGGGAGGSIWITASNLAGSGSILANGGRSFSGSYGTGGGGSGGRIAAYFTNNSFAGTLSAYGGYGNQYGGAGTVYTKAASQTWGQLTLNNGGNAGAGTVLPGNAQEFDNLVIQGQAQVQVPTNDVLTLVPTVLTLETNYGLTINGQLLCAGQPGGQFTQVQVANGGTMTLGAGGQLACADLQVLSGGTFVLNATNALTANLVEVLTNGTLLLNAPVSFPTMHVATNGVVSCTVGQSNLNLTVTGNLTVDLGGSVLVDGLGYQGPGSGNGNGPGGGGGGVAGSYTPGGGGGYGGNGGNSTGAGGGASYGSLTAPTNWGSSGGTGHDTYSGYYYIGGNGGGAMQLVVGGQLQVNGQITANGINGGTQGNGWYPGGGGAGGSIWITASNLAGSGSILANGGRSFSGSYGTGGGGSGGRIALYFTNNSFAGALSAYGGYGSQYGGAGTVYTKAASQTWGQLTLNNGGNAGAGTVLPGNAQEFDNLVIQGQAQVQVPTNDVLTLVPTVLTLETNYGLTINGQLLCAGQPGGQFTQVQVANGGTMTLGAGGQLACADLQVLSGGTFVLNATNALTANLVEVLTNGTLLLNAPVSFPTMHVATNGVVSCTVGQSNLNLTVTGNLTVDLGGSVLVDGLGYQGPGSGNGNGPGGGGGGVAGSYTPGGGGGYGGNGGNSTGAGGGAGYGSLTAPTNWGSSGGTGHDTYSGYYYIGGNGGGAMQLVVGGQLLVNGQITANGVNGGTQGNGWYPGGGGAGGSIWITASNLAGSGSILANGGRSFSGSYGTGGGGSGGRIAAYFTNNSFAGTLSAYGGYGNQYGGAGTIYTKAASQTWGQLTLNNGGNAGAGTVLPGNAQEFDNLVIQGQAQVQVPTNDVLTLVPTVLTLETNYGLTINGQLLCAGQPGGQFTQVQVANGGTMTLGAGGQLACADLQVLSGGTFVLNATNALTANLVEVLTNGTLLLNAPVSFPTMHVATNGVVSCTVGQSNLNLTVTGNLTVDLGGSVLVDGLGYQGPGSGNGNGPGGGGGGVAGSYTPGGGGGYGGNGGNSTGAGGGAGYGSLTAPTNWGSSGGTGHDSYSGYYYPGGNGGGAMQLVVGGQLQVNGQITANGNNAASVGSGYYYYPGGGGAGGSLWITASNLAGTGSILANGGRSWSGNYGTGGGGSGGRIAAYFTNYAFSGIISVNGGSGYQSGQAGTVYSTPQNHSLTLDSQVLGILTTPVSVDNWYLTGVAGQQVSLQNVNMSVPGVVFDFSGPNGWTGFTGITNQSALLTLPTSGTYTVTARGSGGSGGYTYTFDLQETAETNIVIGTPLSENFTASGQAQLFVFTLTNGSPMLITLGNTGAGNVTELYVGLGSPPTRGSYTYHATVANSASQQILIPEAVGGTYYVLVYANQISTPGAYTLSATTSGLFLTSVFPASLAAGADAVLTLSGAGFDSSTSVQLVATNGSAYSSRSVSVNTFNQMTAAFASNSVPVGLYSVLVAKGDGSTSELTNVFQLTPGGQANLVTHLSVPGIIGRHEPATFYVQYANTGNAAMPAPLLMLTGTQNPIMALTASLTPLQQQEAFWTETIPPGWSTNLQFLGWGETPGVLQPGESLNVAVSYGGLQQPWNFSLNNVQFTLGVLAVTNTDPVNWSSLQSTMQPANIASDAWNAIFQNFTNEMGPTWGSYVQSLDNASSYLGQLGLNVTDIGRLVSFEVQRADAMNIVPYLAGGLDAYVPTPGVALTFQRVFAENISGRYKLGVLGRGWDHNWDMTISNAPDGSSVTVLGPGTSVRRFLVNTLGGYFNSPGDYGQLTSLGGGVFTLQEKSGIVEAFSSNGTLNYIQDPNGNRITCGYSGNQLTSLTHSSGQSLTLAYNGSGTIASITDSLSRQTTFGYDASGQHLTSATYFDGSTVAYNYTDPATAAANPTLAHALTQITSPTTNHEYIAYDNQGRLANLSLDGGAQSLSFSYDMEGTVFVTDVSAHTTTFYLNNNGLIAKVQNPINNSVFFTYDANFNLTTFTDPTGRSYNYAYDVNGNLTQFADALGKSANFTYQAPFNRLASLVDANANLTTYSNDTKYNLRSISYADSSAEKWGYDTVGDPITWTNRRGQSIVFQFNSSGQPTSKTYSDGETINYSYNSHSLLTNIADSVQGVTRILYDAQDNVTNVTYPDGSGFSFTYDSAGRRTSRIGFDGYTLKYGYDAAGRLATLTDASNNQLVQYTYDANGRLSTETKGNGTVTTYSYNPAGQLAALTNAAPGGIVQSFFNYGYDAKGNQTAMTNAAGVTAYTYDDLNQLTGVNYPSGRPVTYAYDAMRNRTVVNDTGTNNTYTANSLNEYSQAGGTIYGYDADGNMISQTNASGTTAYQYDTENRLVRVTTPTNGTWQYVYDSLGNRAATVYNGATNHFLLDPFGLVDVAAEYNSSGNLVARYNHGLGLVERVDNGGNAAYYSFDALGNTRQMTGNGGTIMNSYDYDAFGAATLASGTVSNVFLFVGRFGVVDEPDGLHFMRKRFYSASVGRFLNLDPLNMGIGDLYLYRYANNSPLQNLDPIGLRSVTISTPWGQYTFGYNPTTGNTYFGIGYGFGFGGYVTSDSSGQLGWSIDGGPFGVSVDPADTIPGIYGSGSLVPGVGGQIGQTVGNPGNFNLAGGLGADISGGIIFQLPFNAGTEPPTPPATSTTPVNTTIPTIQDPNQLVGPTGYASQNFVEDGNLFAYEIIFANETNATAPAQIVNITDSLSTNLNWTTFQLTEIAFGTQFISIPPNVQYFQTNVPVSYNGFNFQLEIQAGINLGTGQVFANFTSINPTNDLPPPVGIGFLPPENGTGIGTGHISYFIRPNPNLPTGLQISNVAYIQFDQNPALATDLIDDNNPSLGVDTNKMALITIDSTPPVSAVNTLPAIEPTTTFAVTWGGRDVGSGIAGYDIYVAMNTNAYTLWQSDTPTNMAMFTGQNGQTYRFYSAAHDGAGNVEAPHSTPDAVTTVAGVMITSCQRGTNGIISLTFTSLPGTTNIVEGSTNLQSWLPVGFVINTNQPLQFADNDSLQYPMRFYRIWIATNPVPPVITGQPQNSTNAVGTVAQFTAVVPGPSPMGYQWQFDGTNLTDNGRIFGSQSNVLTVSNLDVGDTGGYSLVITNVMGATNTITAMLAVVPPPTITSLTPCQTIFEGTNAVFTVTASSLTPVNYQWQFNETNILGATNSTLTIPEVQLTNTGSYSIIVSNLAGTVTSNTCLSVVTFTASQSGSAYYQSPGSFVVNCQVGFAYDRDMYFLVWEPTLPSGWTLTNASGNGNPQISGSELIFDGPFPNPLNFTYTVNIPAGQNGTQQIFGDGLYFLSGMTDTATAPAVPNPLLANYGTLLSLLVQNGQPQLTLQGDLGRRYRVQSSTNLESWFDLFTITNTTSITYTNLPFTNNVMFFRTVSP